MKVDPYIIYKNELIVDQRNKTIKLIEKNTEDKLHDGNLNMIFGG